MIPVEIERKFLISQMPTLFNTGVDIVQGYLHEGSPTTRVRIFGQGSPGAVAYLTIKGKAKKLVKPEFEYEIPNAEADYMIDKLCDKRLVYKTRYQHVDSGHIFEIDVFKKKLKGLIVCEIEFESEADARAFVKPDWLGLEVTDDKRYKNKKLSISQCIPDGYVKPKKEKK